METCISLLIGFYLVVFLWSLEPMRTRTDFEKEAAHPESSLKDHSQKIDEIISKIYRCYVRAAGKHNNNSLTTALESVKSSEKPTNQKISSKLNTSDSLNEKRQANTKHVSEKSVSLEDRLQKIDEVVLKHYRRFVRAAVKDNSNSLTAAVESVKSSEKPTNQKISSKLNTSGSLDEKRQANTKHVSEKSVHERKGTSKHMTKSNKKGDEVHFGMTTPHNKFAFTEILSHFNRKLPGIPSEEKKTSTQAKDKVTVNSDESRHLQSLQNETKGNLRLAENSDEASNTKSNNMPPGSSEGIDEKVNRIVNLNTTVSSTTSAHLTNDNERYRSTELEKNLDNTKNSQNKVIPLEKILISPSSIVTGNENLILANTSEKTNSKNEQLGENLEEAKYRQPTVTPNEQLILSQKMTSHNTELTNEKGSQTASEASLGKVKHSKQDVITVTENAQKIAIGKKTTTTAVLKERKEDSRTENKSGQKLDKTKQRSSQTINENNKDVSANATATGEMTNNKTNESGEKLGEGKYRQNEVIPVEERTLSQETNSDSAKSINEKENQMTTTPESKQHASTAVNAHIILNSKKTNLGNKTESMTTRAASITRKEDGRKGNEESENFKSKSEKPGQNSDEAKYPENTAAIITETRVNTTEKTSKIQSEKQVLNDSKDNYGKKADSLKTEPEQPKDVKEHDHAFALFGKKSPKRRKTFVSSEPKSSAKYHRITESVF